MQILRIVLYFYNERIKTFFLVIHRSPKFRASFMSRTKNPVIYSVVTVSSNVKYGYVIQNYNTLICQGKNVRLFSFSLNKNWRFLEKRDNGKFRSMNCRFSRNHSFLFATGSNNWKLLLKKKGYDYTRTCIIAK